MAFTGVCNSEVGGLRFEPRKFGPGAWARYPSSLSQSAQPHHHMPQPGQLQPQTFISHSSGDCKFKTKVPANLVPGENPFSGLQKAMLSTVSSQRECSGTFLC